MIFYDVTVSVDREIENKWCEWMVRDHIPEVLKTGYFLSASISRILEPVATRPSFQIRYVCRSLARYREYASKAAPALQRDHTERFEGRFSATRSIMESLADFPGDGAGAESS